jgi:hypothetical protein
MIRQKAMRNSYSKSENTRNHLTMTWVSLYGRNQPSIHYTTTLDIRMILRRTELPAKSALQAETPMILNGLS